MAHSERTGGAEHFLDEAKELCRAGKLDHNSFYPLLKSYIFLRLGVLESECGSDSLEAISKRSIELMLTKKNSSSVLNDVSPGCRSVSTFVARKVLLLIAIQKSLNIAIPAIEVPRIETVEQLVDVLLPLMMLQSY